MNIQELSSVSGLALGDVRVVTQLLFGREPLDPHSELSPGETAVILVYDALSRLGLTRDRCLLITSKLLRDEIIKCVEEAKPEELGLLFIVDNRYVGFYSMCHELVDLETLKKTNPGDMPLPIISITLCVVSLYLRTCATLQSRHAAAEAARSGRSSPADDETSSPQLP